jgi:hypothetical protein
MTFSKLPNHSCLKESIRRHLNSNKYITLSILSQLSKIYENPLLFKYLQRQSEKWLIGSICRKLKDNFIQKWRSAIRLTSTRIFTTVLKLILVEVLISRFCHLDDAYQLCVFSLEIIGYL